MPSDVAGLSAVAYVRLITMQPKPTAPSSSSKRKPKIKKRQRVDRLTDLRLYNAAIDRDAKILEVIKEAYRRNRLDKRYRAQLKTRQTLYCNYRGPRFPLRQGNGKKLPAWRTLSPWMKLQVATMVMGEHGLMMFVVHIHGELREQLEAEGKDQKVYLRDRIGRALRAEFGEGRWFYLVMEDRDTDCESVRPHAHGAIDVRGEPLPGPGEPHHVRFRRLASKKGIKHAEWVWGLLRVRKALRAASGNLSTRRPRIVNGVHQHRNIYLQKPTGPFTNERWVTYAFKNVEESSNVLGEARMAWSQALQTESRRLWELMRKGEDALDLWP